MKQRLGILCAVALASAAPASGQLMGANATKHWHSEQGRAEH